MLVKYFSGVANDGSSSLSQRCCVSSFASSRFCGAIAAILVVAFVMLAAFAFVYSATTSGHSDPVGGGCFQSGRAATLAALLVTSFVFVLLWSIGHYLAGVLNYIGLDVSDGVCAFVGAFWCLDGDIVVFCSRGSCTFTAASCISSFCAFVGDFPILEGIKCFLDGAIVVGLVAHALEGVYWICCCSSSGKGLVPHSKPQCVCLTSPLLSVSSSSPVSSPLFESWRFVVLGWPFPKSQRFCLSRELSKFISHGTVSSLRVVMEQASGRVDVFDGAKIEAAAAFAGTYRSRPGKLGALGSVQSREDKVQFFPESI